MSNASLCADVPALDEPLEAQCPNMRVDLVSHIVMANLPNLPPTSSSTSSPTPMSYSREPACISLTATESKAAVSSTNATSTVKFVNNTMENLQSKMSSCDDAPKRKRARTSPEQLRILQKAFSVEPMPTAASRITLAAQLGMTPRAVQVWFQNRRAKGKLEGRKEDDASGVGVNSSANFGDVSQPMPSAPYYSSYQAPYDTVLSPHNAYPSTPSMYAPYYGAAYYDPNVYDYYKSMSYPTYASSYMANASRTASSTYSTSMDAVSSVELTRSVSNPNITSFHERKEVYSMPLSATASTSTCTSSSIIPGPSLTVSGELAQRTLDSNPSVNLVNTSMNCDDHSSQLAFYFSSEPGKAAVQVMGSAISTTCTPVASSPAASCPSSDDQMKMFQSPTFDSSSVSVRGTLLPDVSLKYDGTAPGHAEQSLCKEGFLDADSKMGIASYCPSSALNSRRKVIDTIRLDHSLTEPTFELTVSSPETSPTLSTVPSVTGGTMMPMLLYSDDQMMGSVPQSNADEYSFRLSARSLPFSERDLDAFTDKGRQRPTSLVQEAFRLEPTLGKSSSVDDCKMMPSSAKGDKESSYLDGEEQFSRDRKSLYINSERSSPPPLTSDVRQVGAKMHPSPSRSTPTSSSTETTSATSWYHQSRDFFLKDSFYGYPDFEEMTDFQNGKHTGPLSASAATMTTGRNPSMLNDMPVSGSLFSQEFLGPSSVQHDGKVKHAIKMHGPKSASIPSEGIYSFLTPPQEDHFLAAPLFTET